MDKIKQSVAFAEDFLKHYCTLRDIAWIKNCLAPDATWVAPGGNKAYQNCEEIVAMLEQEKKQWNNYRLIHKTCCDASALSPDFYTVFGSLVLEEKSTQEPLLVSNMRFMMVCRLQGEQFLLQQLQITLQDSAPIMGNGPPLSLVTDYYKSIRELLEERTEELNRQNEEFKMLLQNIPGCVLRVLNDKKFTICRMYDGLSKLLGYSQEEIAEQFQNQYIHLICKEDVGWVSEQLRGNLAREPHYEIIYRARHKDGSLIWVLEKGQLVEKGCPEESFYCVLMDITDTILAQEALQISEERYRIVSEQSNDIIFEVNLLDHTLAHSPLFEKKFGYMPDITDFPQNILSCALLHPDDLGLANVAYKNLCVGEGRLQSELRVRKDDGSYLWCTIQMTTIFDVNHNPLKIIGKLMDIDDQKKEKERLIEKARRDLLTGLYNKMTTQALIKQCIASSQSSQQHMLMVIDVDNFKGINDSLGHQIGDAVLHEVAVKLQRLFCGAEIVGRIGGDEFIVLLTDVLDFDLAEQKAQEVCKIFRSLSFGSRVSAMVSGSVGVSCYPRDGVTYTQLFKKADEALYYAKEHGRDCYCVYDAARLKKPRGMV